MNYIAGGTGKGQGFSRSHVAVGGSRGQRPNLSWTKHMKYGANFSLFAASFFPITQKRKDNHFTGGGGGGGGGGRVVRWCWVNFQCRGVLQLLDYSRARAYCACSRCGGGCLDIFTLIYPFSPLSPSLWETARYRLKYCLKGPLNPKQTTNNQSLLG